MRISKEDLLAQSAFGNFKRFPTTCLLQCYFFSSRAPSHKPANHLPCLFACRRNNSLHRSLYTSKSSPMEQQLCSICASERKQMVKHSPLFFVNISRSTSAPLAGYADNSGQSFMLLFCVIIHTTNASVRFYLFKSYI